MLVGALGHEFGPNPERGIYLTTDGGRTWKQVLKVDDNTGVVDLARDPEHPAVVYAAAWQMRLHPYLDYFIPQAGPGSGIYRSEDGGETWTRLAGTGLPEGSAGPHRAGGPRGSGGGRVYATVIAPGGGNGFYRSDDGGRSWKLLNDDPELANDYFSRITTAPDDPDVVYVMGRSIHRSDDGGAHFTIFKGSPGGDDYHFMWIDPAAPDHMISGADQGAAVTVNGGASWSSWYNQPTGQFYHLAADQRFPYRIYSGQQDNGTVEIASRGALRRHRAPGLAPGGRRRARLHGAQAGRSRTWCSGAGWAATCPASTRSRGRWPRSRRGRCPATGRGRPA